MKNLGYISGGAGLLLSLYAGLFYKVSIEADFGEREIINIGLQQDRLLLFLFALTLIVVGTILVAGNLIEEALKPASDPPANEPSVQAPAASHAPASGEDPEWIEAEMARLGVTRKGDKFAFGPHLYDRLEDAMAYALLRRP